MSSGTLGESSRLPSPVYLYTSIINPCGIQRHYDTVAAGILLCACTSRPDVTKTSKSDSQGSKPQDITTIKVSRETWARLNRRKTGPGESFDDIVGDLLAAVEDDDGPSE